MSKHTKDAKDNRSDRKNRQGVRRAVTAFAQGTAVAAIYFGLFSILAYPVVDAAGLL